MIETMKVYGGNNYKVPHLGKYKLEQERQLSLTLYRDSNLVDQAKRLVSKQYSKVVTYFGTKLKANLDTYFETEGVLDTFFHIPNIILYKYKVAK
jgi:hypothetical protein